MSFRPQTYNRPETRFPVFTGFYRILPVFTCFYLFLPAFSKNEKAPPPVMETGRENKAGRNVN